MRAREVIIKIMIIVKIMIWKMDGMTDWERNKLWLEQETGQIYTRLKSTSTRLKITKNNGREKKIKNNGKTPTMGHYPRIGWMGDIDPHSNMQC